MTVEQLVNDIPSDVARGAYSGVSFNSDRRGDQARLDYANTLASDYKDFAGFIADKPDMQATLDAEFERYRQSFKQRTLAYLHSNARCVSWFIAGPSNFPVRRMEKRQNSAEKRLDELLEFRKRARAAIIKTLCPTRGPIMAGDSDAVERLREKIAEAEKEQEQMKAVNAAHKAFLKNPESLDSAPFSDAVKATIRNYKPKYSWEPHPIAPYQLTNNSANIRRMKERLAGLERSKAAPTSEVKSESGIRLEDCPADNRIRLFFPGKPDESVRSRLKSNGFRWSPTIGCWQAYRNSSSLDFAQRTVREIQDAA